VTPAQQALAEAAALESARVYGSTCPEYHAPTTETRPRRPALRVIHNSIRPSTASGQPAA
jgi:hypothetical protein